MNEITSKGLPPDEDIDFWIAYTTRLKAAAGWTVFEHGTLVHPFDCRGAEKVLANMAQSLLLNLHDALGGMSGAGSPLGDVSVKEVSQGHYVISYGWDLPILNRCTTKEMTAAAVESNLKMETDEDMLFIAGVVGRKKRNRDAASRNIKYTKT